MRSITHSAEEVSVQYDGKMTICSNGSLLEVKSYPHTRKRVREGYEPDEIYEHESPVKKKPKKREEQTGPKQIEKRNLNRTRNTIMAYASENEMIWTSFLTLTFKDNVTDVTQANKCFDNWRRQIQRMKPDFAYLAVPEFQKRGAVHYHLLTNLECGKDLPERDPIKTWNEEKQKTYDLYYYDLPYWKQGYSSAQDLTTMDDSFNCALYLIKYLFKDMDGRLWGHKKILKSNNLRSPKTYYLNTLTFHGALAYIQEKGYPISVHDFQPYERFQEPHTCYTLRERLSPDDRDTVETIVSASYSESHDRQCVGTRTPVAPGPDSVPDWLADLRHNTKQNREQTEEKTAPNKKTVSGSKRRTRDKTKAQQEKNKGAA